MVARGDARERNARYRATKRMEYPMEKTIFTAPSRAQTFDVSQSRARILDGARFDWAFTLLSAFFVFGLFLDGWAHTHGQVDESFFTPWHGVLYSAHLSVLLFLSANVLVNLRRGFSFAHALPNGYLLSLVGALLFILGGVGDLIWHTLFGIEQDVEALYSPTHLLLAGAAMLIVTGPLRAAWRRDETPTHLRAQMPLVLSLTLTLSVLTFFTQIAYPLANLWGSNAWFPSPALNAELGVVSLQLSAVLITGFVLFALHRFPLAPGALSLLLGINALAMGALYDQGAYPLFPVLAFVSAGIVADILLHLLKASPTRMNALRVFAFALPALMLGFYFTALELTEGVWWAIHLSAGSIVKAGVIGLLLSFLAMPPRNS